MQKVLNVKKGDTVVVITGKDAGKKGKVLASYPTKNRVVVEGVNMITKHQKPRSAQDKGGIIKKEGTIEVSNVMVVCPVCGKATRVKHAEKDGKKVRVCKCGESLDKKYSKVAKKTTKAEEKPAKAAPKAATKKSKPRPKQKQLQKRSRQQAQTKPKRVFKAQPKRATRKGR